MQPNKSPRREVKSVGENYKERQIFAVIKTFIYSFIKSINL